MIRKINENDRDAFLAMTEDFYNSDAVYYRIPKEYRERTFEELMRSDVYTEGFIFEKDGKTAGYALISKSFSQEAGGIVVWLEELMILPEYRSRGLSTEFFHYLEENVPAARYRLETEPGNEGAVRLYKRMGYEFCPYTQWIKETNQNE
ncbi:MAG: GNAT family N-acetyltransferase [Clostridia bacterium]